MKRYPHFLRKAKRARFPARIVALAASSMVDQAHSTPTLQRECLVKWHACGVTLKDGVPCKDWSGRGTDADSCWQGVDWGLRRGGVTLCVSFGAARTWGLLGLWNRVERGEVYFGESYGEESSPGHPDVPVVPQLQPGTPGGAVPRELPTPVPLSRLQHGLPEVGGERRQGQRRHRPSTCVVLADPPNIVSVRVVGQPGRLVIVDLRNWGIAQCPIEGAPAREARWVLERVLHMIAMIQARGWGSLCLTAAAQALHTFRFAYLTHAIHCHVNPEALRLEGEAYYGGRCEAFRLGAVPGVTYHLDYRSLYPGVCADELLPTQLIATGRGTPPVAVDRADGSVGAIARVLVETDAPDYPLRRDGLTVYPTGRFWTTLAGPELAHAQRAHRVRAWGAWSSYRLEPCLRAYAQSLWNALWAARTWQDGPMVAWLKALSVGLPGKLGQHGSSWIDAPDALPPGPWCQWTHRGADGETARYRALAWHCQRETKIPWSEDAVPALAAWITSAARVRLLTAIYTAGPDRVWYVDTDALFTDEEGCERLYRAGLVRDNELGQLRLVGDGNDFEAFGIKHYTFGGQRKCSGVPRGTVEAGPDQTSYWYRDWLARAVAGHHAPLVERVLRKYARDGAYRHGIVQDDNRVEPLFVWED